MKKFFAILLAALGLLAGCQLPPEAAAGYQPALQMEESSAEARGDFARSLETAPEASVADAGGDVPAATPEPVYAPTPLPPATGPSKGGTVDEMPDIMWAADGSWRVDKAQTYSYGPELGYSEPGFGSAQDEVGIVVGYDLRVYTAHGLVDLGEGCVQLAFPPGVYARNMGGTDWGAIAYEWNPTVTSWENELLVLTWEAAKQQVQWESCPNLPDHELLSHVFVIEQDGQFVKATPWREYRRASGVDRTIMFGPGDRVYGWHMGLGSAWTGVAGQNGQDNLCNNGGCYLPVAPTFGWVGGGVINSTWPGEIPADAQPISVDRINAVLQTLPPE